jgi:hypothetical protein
MKDNEFLMWLTSRLINVYREEPGTDFVGKLFSIAAATPIDRETPNTGTKDMVVEYADADRPDHIPDESCWCHPKLEYQDTETGAKVWTHRQMH